MIPNSPFRIHTFNRMQDNLQQALDLAQSLRNGLLTTLQLLRYVHPERVLQACQSLKPLSRAVRKRTLFCIESVLHAGRSLYEAVEELQADLDAWLIYYNTE